VAVNLKYVGVGSPYRLATMKLDDIHMSLEIGKDKFKVKDKLPSYIFLLCTVAFVLKRCLDMHVAFYIPYPYLVGLYTWYTFWHSSLYLRGL